MLTPAQLDQMLISKHKARNILELDSFQFDWILRAVGVAPYRISGVTFILKDDLEKLKGNQFLRQAKRIRSRLVVEDDAGQDISPSEALESKAA